MAVKRKAAGSPATSPPSKKRDAGDTKAAFRSDLFEPATVKQFHDDYAASGPYPHAVVSNLIQEQLLRDVRSEITENVQFTLKETDIYRIHQSGDLANLSNLDQESLKRLPSLVKLRDALYSTEFREWVSEVTGAGKLSGRKTDMAVNVYTPGSYLLCHDDVIGSRRVSYILYLTDPDTPWQPDWGGGLRLYPTEPKQNKKGEEIKVPLAEWSENIPPSSSQLSFFAVSPGESYHDVEEVYHGANADEDKSRIRMAVSGWFHIPQEGEEGFERGLEEAQAQKSSLAQLQGAADEFDEPQVRFRHFDEPRRVANAQADGTEEDPGEDDDEDETILTEQDLTFLIQYIAPGFLVPDKLEELAQAFEETSMLQLDTFLAEKFTKLLKPYIERAGNSNPAESIKPDVAPSTWPLARPPHKHRFAYLAENTQAATDVDSPISLLLQDLLHSHAFKKWLALATGLRPHALTSQHALARRFRAGHDYALASTYTGDLPRLEFTINLTPSTGWERLDAAAPSTNGKTKPNGTSMSIGASIVDAEPVEYGGEEVYMTADEDDAASKALPAVGKKAAHDPAVYRSGDDNDDDGILFNSAPSWNTFSVVLRDKNTMRFVKYVSQAAKGDRWDIKGEIDLADDAFDDDDQSDEEDGIGQLGHDDVEEEIEYELDDEDPGDEDEDEAFHSRIEAGNESVTVCEDRSSRSLEPLVDDDGNEHHIHPRFRGPGGSGRLRAWIARELENHSFDDDDHDDYDDYGYGTPPDYNGWESDSYHDCDQSKSDDNLNEGIVYVSDSEDDDEEKCSSYIRDFERGYPKHSTLAVPEHYQRVAVRAKRPNSLSDMPDEILVLILQSEFDLWWGTYPHFLKVPPSGAYVCRKWFTLLFSMYVKKAKPSALVAMAEKIRWEGEVSRPYGSLSALFARS